MQKKVILIVTGCVVVVGLLIAILAVMSATTGDDSNEEDRDGIENLEPVMKDGKYEPAFFTKDQLNRIIVIHFNVEKLATPLFLCPIERYIDLNMEVMIFTPNSTLIEENLPYKESEQITYYDYKDLPELFFGLPIESLYIDKLYSHSSQWSDMILGDLIRLAAIYKYGGTYADLDVMPNRVYYEDEMGLAGPQDNDYIGSAYFRFPRHSPIVWLVMEKIAEYHPLEEWASFSTLPITKILRDYCGVVYDKCEKTWTQPQRNLDSECANIKILDVNDLYPIHWGQESKYIEDYDQLSDEVKKRVEGAIGMHWWNGPLKKSGCLNETALLAHLARDLCPGIYEKHQDTLICSRRNNN